MQKSGDSENLRGRDKEGTESRTKLNGDEYSLTPVRCSGCGRFLGYSMMTDGLVLILCKNCSQWAILAEGVTGGLLTTEEIYDILKKGRKAKSH